MLEISRWKYILILCVLAVSVVYALPNLYQKQPAVQVTVNRDAPLTLPQVVSRLQQALARAAVPVVSINVEEKGLVVRLPSLKAQTQANDLIRQLLDDHYTVALNLASTVPHWLTAIGAKPMVQGLDLVGGVYFTLQIDQKTVIDKQIDAAADEIRTLLHDSHIDFQIVQRQADQSINIDLGPGAEKSLFDKAERALARLQPTFKLRPNGQLLIAQLPASEVDRLMSSVVEQNILTLRNRVNALGVAEPIIQRQGQDRIAVQLPGVQDTAEAKRLMGATATLEFRGVVDADAVEAKRTGLLPPEARLYTIRGTQQPLLLNKRVIASGDEMVNATVASDENGLPAVNVTLNTAAGQRMLAYTQAHLGQLMSVVYIESIPTQTIVNGHEERHLITRQEALAPTRIAAVFGSQFRTTGLDKAEAENLARLLRAGSLAAPMDFVEERVIGPSLGAENVARGVTAVVFAFVFTLLFFGIYYRVFGLITSLALIVNLLIVVAVLSICGATLTLPGFAGLALSIGLSVDANVLVNERIREELRLGMPAKAAIATGYIKARGTIFDANLSGIIAGIALYAFGTGPLKGFAVTLIVGILASMFTAITVSRTIAVLIYRRRSHLKTLAI